MTDSVTKLWPGWKEAVTQIVDRVNRDGYGVMFSHETLYAMMDIKVPETGTKADFAKHGWEVLTSLENLKTELLKEHKFCLHNVKGQGYKVLHPDDQVTIAADKRFRCALHHLGQALAVLTHVDPDALSMEGQQEQVRRLGKAAFLISGMSKQRKVGGGKEGDLPKAVPDLSGLTKDELELAAHLGGEVG